MFGVELEERRRVEEVEERRRLEEVEERRKLFSSQLPLQQYTEHAENQQSVF